MYGNNHLFEIEYIKRTYESPCVYRKKKNERVVSKRKDI